MIPVKRFAAAKQRLQPEIATAERTALAERMIEAVFAEIGRARRIARTIVVSGEPGAVALAERFGYEVVADEADAGHSQAAMLGIARAVEHGAGAVALLPGDCPALRAAEIDELLAAIEPPHVAVIPDRHGTGTNGLVIAPPDAIEPAFGEGSCARHAGLAEAAGMPHSIRPLSSLALDIDTAEDLALWRGSS
ncbi:MAG: 2-phospho-L-lactate/phosphoenolpyruvate guanylyltransferase [Solirubrobacterales bacterium]|nr:2-phospho-L-lactate/phosphoenolpyruvate guanylyltransferase [Solirubrobacterales bacterium]MDX6653296.1 2-phospho-L-lactate/phosphoenolpyruvate guanylyltransferase [Solirubrobacterales bacterium]MDX6663406.1 2-phospho-L-lactate/phosphoenolpyruvate guanylyltransferase [Solirubrobacterales bacterium]